MLNPEVGHYASPMTLLLLSIAATQNPYLANRDLYILALMIATCINKTFVLYLNKTSEKEKLSYSHTLDDQHEKKVCKRFKIWVLINLHSTSKSSTICNSANLFITQGTSRWWYLFYNPFNSLLRWSPYAYDQLEIGGKQEHL